MFINDHGGKVVVAAERTRYELSTRFLSNTPMLRRTIAKLAGDRRLHLFSPGYIQRIRFSEVDPDQATKLEWYKSQGYTVVEDPGTPYTQVVEIPTKTSMVSTLEDMNIMPHYAQSANEVQFVDFLQIQAMYQRYWADNAISSTINIHPEAYNVEEVMEV